MATKKKKTAKKKLTVKKTRVALTGTGGGAGIGPSAIERAKPILESVEHVAKGSIHLPGIDRIAGTVAASTAVGSLATGIWVSTKKDG
jgi:hypothetical protein